MSKANGSVYRTTRNEPRINGIKTSVANQSGGSLLRTFVIAALNKARPRLFFSSLCLTITFVTR